MSLRFRTSRFPLKLAPLMLGLFSPYPWEKRFASRAVILAGRDSARHVHLSEATRGTLRAHPLLRPALSVLRLRGRREGGRPRKALPRSAREGGGEDFSEGLPAADCLRGGRHP